ncbi:cytochrome c-type biogenesis protein CcsB [Helicobacter didelphidarum]|uniref:Cytochrome c-type biogenesis protein CcsB n=1 Tax=Helicobacter didelphidarum TaxID=2040648 RepID=A0A3D8IR15_9HELI|nr:cytochrome c-type biogenesis protein CcsB [Helicobacter didelphidarum]
MLVYAIAIGWATFIEKDFGTLVANDVIYHSWWFEFLNVWLLINILGCMYKSAKINLKVNVQIFHIALVIIIIGAGITRYFGFEGRMVLADGETSSFIASNDSFLNVLVSNDVGDDGTQSDIIPLESFKKGYDIMLSPYVRFSSFDLDTKEVFDKKLRIKSINVINYSLASLFSEAAKEKKEVSDQEIKEKQKENHYVAKFEVEYDGITKEMFLSNRGEIRSERFGNRYVTLSWGPKSILLPFSLKLEKFEVLTYPGSLLESSFASYVEVIDPEHTNYKYKIFMNNVLDYRGYRFFQSEYNVERDENGEMKRDETGMPIYTGTILAVNNDPGKVPTYIGYTLMILGAIWLLFDNSSRFRKLSNCVKSQKIFSVLIPFTISFFAISVPHVGFAQDSIQLSSEESLVKNDMEKHLVLDSNNFFLALNESKKIESSSSQRKDEENISKQTDTEDSEEVKKRLEQFVAYNKSIEQKNQKLEPLINDMSKEAIQKRVDGLKKIPKKSLKIFAKLQIQGMEGRVKLFDTYSDEVMRKIVGKTHIYGLDHNQFLLGIMVMPKDMAKLRFIKVKDPEIRKLLGVLDKEYVSFEDLFYSDKLDDVYDFATYHDQRLMGRFLSAYKLYHFSNIARKKPEWERNEFDKEVLKLDEKMDMLLPYSIWDYMKIFPEVGDDNWKIMGNPHLSKDLFTKYFYLSFITESRMGINLHEWKDFDTAIDLLHRYQRNTAGKLLLDSTHVKSELLLNQLNIFPVVEYFYLCIGILLFFIALIAIIVNKKIPKWLGKGLYSILLIAFLGHTLGLILRWYIGGHAPWSNPYESMLYIAWASALSGIIILRKSYFAMCGASFLAGMALVVAHWGFMDPYIGNLQPVLHSYWLNIHVAVIVASYGFLGLSLMLGVTNLILFIFRKESRPQIDKSIVSLSAINEMSMIIGILMLIVGTFLGGVWANESWGRYWSWDSKETWSLVSVGVYACVLHVRLLRPLYLPYIFNVFAVLAFYSIIMTYFGVNYYLATGLHSYARGDVGGINAKIYLALILTFLLIFISFFKRKLMFNKDF